MDQVALGMQFIVIEERTIDGASTVSPIAHFSKLDAAKRKMREYINANQRLFSATVFRDKEDGSGVMFFNNSRGEPIKVKVSVRPCRIVAQL